MATIINTVLAGGGGDVVEAYADNTLAVDDKVELIPSYKELTAITGLPTIGASASGMAALINGYVVGTQAYGVYQVDTSTNVATQVSSTSAIPTNNFSKAFGPIYQHMYNGNVLFINGGGGYYVSSTGTSSFNGSYDSTVGGSPEGFTLRISGNTPSIIEHVDSSGTISFYNTMSDVTGNIQRIVKGNNLIVWGSVMKKFTFNSDGTYTETALTDSTCASNFTYQNRFLNLDNKNYITMGAWTNNTSTNLSAFRLDEKSELSYDFVSVPFPKVITACVNGKKITAMGSLAGGGFYIATSSAASGESNLRDYLYIFSIPGDDISSAVLEDVIQTDDRGYRMMILSYDGSLVLDQYMSSTSGAPTLRKRVSNGHEYTAVSYDGLPKGNGSLIGFVKKVNGDGTVDVITALPPESTLTVTAGGNLDVDINKI